MSVRDQRISEIDAQIKADNAIVAGRTRQVETAKKSWKYGSASLSEGAGAPLDVMTCRPVKIDLQSRLLKHRG